MKRSKKDKEARAAVLITFENTWRFDGGQIAGIDESGRGPLAGPVLAACVVWPEKLHSSAVPVELLGIDDSKRVAPRQRIGLFSPIFRHSAAVGIGLASVNEIEEINIRMASHRAMRRAAHNAVKRLGYVADVYLVDGEPVDLELDGVPIEGIKKGDTLSYAIASASIIAKVARDRLMCRYHARYPMYGFDHNKGYGTPGHIAALEKWGPCPAHRMSFLRKIAYAGKDDK